jgi:hypothetical protein
MKPILPKPQRCAIYTRNATEHNLDLVCNSLDAQREACAGLYQLPANGSNTIAPRRLTSRLASARSATGLQVRRILRRVSSTSRGPP